MSQHLSTFVDKLTALGQHPAAPAAPGPGLNPSALFRALLKNEVAALAGPDGLPLAVQLEAQYSDAARHCRQNELPAALDLLVRTDAALAGVPAPVLEFVTLFQLSAWANYHYKVGESARALDEVREGLSRSAALERRGCPTLIYRRTEQLQNMATVYFRWNKPAEAHALLRHTLTFVHSGRAAGLLIDDWDAATLGRVRALQEHRVNNVFHQLATADSRQQTEPGYDPGFFHDFYGRQLLRELTVDTPNRAIVYNWLYCKASYAEQGPAAFLDNVLEFVGDAEVHGAHDVLKANLLAQAAWHSRQQAQEQVAATVQHLARFFAGRADQAKAGVPRKLAA